MKNFLSTLLLACLLLQAQPAFAGGWMDDVVSWFNDLFSITSAVPPVDAAVYADSLRSTPLGLLLNEVPDHDTLAIDRNWPYPSIDPAADLERYYRQLRNTVLLTNPEGRLPLTPKAVRIIYQQDARPGYLIGMAARFGNVQEVAYSELVPEILPISDSLPTIVVADAATRRSKTPWYQELANISLQDVTLLHFGSEDKLIGLPPSWSVISTPIRSRESESFMAQALFGAELIDGRTRTTSPVYPAGTGYRLNGDQPGFRLPEQLGIDRLSLEKIDYQINRGIRYRAMPGAQLLVMKNGQVVYEKAYGHHVYRKQPVTNGDLYDLASVTKAAATSLAVMKLFDEGRIELDKKVRDYLPVFKNSIVGRYRIEQLLTHQTGLQPNMPVGQFMTRDLVGNDASLAKSLPLGPGRWLDNRLPAWIRESVGGKLEYTRKPKFLYSDVNYYLLQQIVEALSGQPLDEFVRDTYYEPMGLGRLAFNPYASFPAERLVPTINEPWMRGGLLRGFVHDEGAALLGGVSGHAGLFGNAHDLGQLFQLLNNGGTYAGREYLRPETVTAFTEHNRFNYRALGFDRLAGRLGDARAHGAGRNTVGHLGFTGTSVWADPENDLVYVLLTNRVNPDPKNEKFIRMNIRSRVGRAVYAALNSWVVES